MVKLKAKGLKYFLTSFMLLKAPEKKSVTTVAENGDTEHSKRNKIQVSNTEKPLFFYVNLAKAPTTPTVKSIEKDSKKSSGK
ncbi:hypothetical protein K1719_014517 [Acacia pycnantha]|nr:hypothetical protein K1719_014517 [Acacia pycnantha]